MRSILRLLLIFSFPLLIFSKNCSDIISVVYVDVDHALSFSLKFQNYGIKTFKLKRIPEIQFCDQKGTCSTLQSHNSTVIAYKDMDDQLDLQLPNSSKRPFLKLFKTGDLNESIYFDWHLSHREHLRGQFNNLPSERSPCAMFSYFNGSDIADYPTGCVCCGTVDHCSDGLPTTSGVTTTGSPTTTENVAPTPKIDFADPGLKNLTRQNITSENAEEILLEALHFSMLQTQLNGDDLTCLSLILEKSVKIDNFTNTIASLFCENVNYLQNINASEIPKSNTRGHGSTERILSSVHHMVAKLEEDFSYMNGSQLGLIVFASLDEATQGITISSGEDSFSGVVPPSFSASIELTQEALSRGDRAYVAIYSTDKLFNVRKGDVYETQRSHDDNCSDGTSSLRRQVMTATLFPSVEVNDSHAVLAIVRYNVSSLLRPLHGRLGVTWWTTMNWSPLGQCDVISDREDTIMATCSHLTDFTLVLNGQFNDPGVCNVPLMTVGYILNTLSITALGIVIFTVTASYIRRWRRSTDNFSGFVDKLLYRNPGRKLETVAYTGVLFVFYFFVAIFKDGKIAGSSCRAMAAIKYSLFMTLVLQSLLFALTEMATLTSWTSRNVQLLGSALPATVVSLTATMSTTLGTTSDFFERDDGFCWVRSDYRTFALTVPLTVTVVTSLSCTGVILVAFFTGRPRYTLRHQHYRELRRRVGLLLSVQLHLGLPWIFQYISLFTPGNTAWQWLFTIVNDSQGLVPLGILISVKCIRGALDKKAKKEEEESQERSQAQKLYSLEDLEGEKRSRGRSSNFGGERSLLEEIMVEVLGQENDAFEGRSPEGSAVSLDAASHSGWSIFSNNSPELRASDLKYEVVRCPQKTQMRELVVNVSGASSQEEDQHFEEEDAHSSEEVQELDSPPEESSSFRRRYPFRTQRCLHGEPPPSQAVKVYCTSSKRQRSPSPVDFGSMVPTVVFNTPVEGEILCHHLEVPTFEDRPPTGLSCQDDLPSVDGDVLDRDEDAVCAPDVKVRIN
ncbi:hypothetical protein QR680_009838 [Steinernema hermaphroditum]|uniref:GPS domain-containing protein n=1 Tax=Steinernema hermaphroditum TaxID=289476 RepID=A0AA39IN38_9BILA|nr:hypothetical protein QR680_009838 [Steinernema hermaphroditum]